MGQLFKTFKTKFDISSVLIFYYFAMTFCTVFISLNLHISSYTKILTLLIPVFLLIKFFIEKKLLFIKYVFISCLLLLSLFLLMILFHEKFSNNTLVLPFGFLNLKYYSIESIYAIPATIMIYVMLCNKESKYLNQLKKYFIIFIVLNILISSFYLIFVSRDISRVLTTGTYYKPLVPVSTFDISYSLVFINILLFHFYKKSEYKSIKYLIAFTICFTYIILSGFTISLFLVIFGIAIYYFLINSNKFKLIFFWSVILLIILNMIFNFMSPILFFIGDNIQTETISMKFTDLGNYFNDGTIGYSISERIKVYVNVIDAVKNSKGFSVFVFDNGASVSNHSTILYTLATTGILGLVLLISSFVYMFKFQISNACDKLDKYFTITIFIVAVVFMILNPIFSRTSILITISLIIPMYIRNKGVVL